MIHKECLKGLAKASARDQKPVKCNTCGEFVSHLEIKENFGADFMEELGKLEVATLISKNQSLVNC